MNGILVFILSQKNMFLLYISHLAPCSMNPMNEQTADKGPVLQLTLYSAHYRVASLGALSPATEVFPMLAVLH